MKFKQIFKNLVCPFCKSRLTIVLKPHHPAWGYCGVATCLCDKYPIIDGIILLKKTGHPKYNKCCEYIEGGNPEKALSLMFDDPFLIRNMLRIMTPYVFGSTIPRLPLSGILKAMSCLLPSRSAWYEYLNNRVSGATFSLSLAPAGTVKPKHIVVDIGCGLGHFLTNTYSFEPEADYIGIDVSFTVLYLARRYIVPQCTLLVCADVENGIPISPSGVDRAYYNDSFMYFKQKRRLLQETHEILSNTGLAFITHVHERDANNKGQGFGITLKEMADYAKLLPILYTSDGNMFSDILHHSVIRYRKIQHHHMVNSSVSSYSFLLPKQRFNNLEYSILPDLKKYFNTRLLNFDEDQSLVDFI